MKVVVWDVTPVVLGEVEIMLIQKGFCCFRGRLIGCSVKEVEVFQKPVANLSCEFKANLQKGLTSAILLNSTYA